MQTLGATGGSGGLGSDCTRRLHKKARGRGINTDRVGISFQSWGGSRRLPSWNPKLSKKKETTQLG